MLTVVYQFGDFNLHCGKFLSFAAKAAGSSLSESLSNFSSCSSPNMDWLLLGMKLQSAFGVGKSSSISNRESIRQFVKFAKFLIIVPTCRSSVQTISGSGYRFIAPVTAANQKSLSQPDPSGEPRFEPASCPDRRSTVNTRRTIGGRAHHRLWLVTALCGFVLIAISIVTLGPHPLAARFLDRDNHAAIASLAVLPLDNLSGDPNQEYFADGMTDELTTMLAKDSTLLIVSRTSAMQFKKANRSLGEIARASTSTASRRLRRPRQRLQVHMTLQLIRANTIAPSQGPRATTAIATMLLRCPTLLPEPSLPG